MSTAREIVLKDDMKIQEEWVGAEVVFKNGLSGKITAVLATSATFYPVQVEVPSCWGQKTYTIYGQHLNNCQSEWDIVKVKLSASTGPSRHLDSFDYFCEIMGGFIR